MSFAASSGSLPEGQRRARGGAPLIAALATVVSVLVLGLVAWLLALAPMRDSVYVLVGDDAGYYFAVARNFCLGHGYSFDRLEPTNGFNPLAVAILVGAYRAFAPGLRIEDCYRIGALVSYAAMLIGFVYFLRLFARLLASGTLDRERRALLVAAAALLYAGFIAPKSNYGMDAFFVLAVGLMYLDRVSRHGLLDGPARSAVLDGVLLGLLFLARVDTLPLLVAAYGLMAVLVGFRLGQPLGLGVRLASTAAIVAPYVVWGHATFGTWLPVSARLKSAFPRLDPVRSLAVVTGTSLNSVDLMAFLIAFAIATGMILVAGPGWMAARRAGRPPTPRSTVMAILATYLVARIGYMLLFSRMDVQGSYVILAHVFNVMCFAFAAEALAGRFEARRAGRGATVASLAALALTLVSLALFAGKARTLVSWRDGVVEDGAGDEVALSRAIHDRTAEGDVLYGGAFGLLGFLADRPWINGDGVANTYGYQRALADDALERHLGDRGVTHVVFVHRGPFVDSMTFEVHSPLHARGSSFRVASKDVILRWPSLRGGGADVCLARWSPPSGAGRGARPR